MRLRNDLPEGLLEDVKNYLNITWTDTATDSKIKGMIANGMMRIDRLCGDPADYSEDGEPRELLFEYVRYARDGALDVFDNNYQARLVSLQNNKAVERYAQKSIQTQRGCIAAV